MQSLSNEGMVPSCFKKVLLAACGALALTVIAGGVLQAQEKMELSRAEATVVVEPYAPNIVRVTLSLRKADAERGPGYGIVAHPASSGWTRQSGESGDVFKSSRMVVTVSPYRHYTPTGTSADLAKFFNGSTPGVGISIRTPEGKQLLDMQGWQMSVPNHKDGNADILYDRRPTDAPFFQVGASFHSPKDEHYYGLGQNQEGYMDRRGHVVRCAHDYNAPAGQSVCVPFVVTNYGYGLMWDNPSRTTVAFGFNDQTRWTSDVGQRVSFFVIAGKT
jgi:alpha-D-xyloside xylohydrolase